MNGYYIKNLSKNKIVSSKNVSQQFIAASLIKPLYAIIAIDKLPLEQDIHISYEMAQSEGTNGLKYIVTSTKGQYISIRALINLMLAVSCNSSTKLIRELIGLDSIREKISNLHLKETNVFKDKRKQALTSLNDLETIYEEVYKTAKYSKIFEFASAINRYYLFDQLKLKIKTSKTGTIKKRGIYTLGNVGIVEYKGELYFVAGYSQKKEISDAVIELRKIGKTLYRAIK